MSKPIKVAFYTKDGEKVLFKAVQGEQKKLVLCPICKKRRERHKKFMRKWRANKGKPTP